ncbi:hypothetical protein F7725_020642 [Dissostichus mawsoni]|uniref:G-protein coupled receptors family 3 profile domain-containing protein n=1 Tax=Dissostichus mawsoni TaxID=36200 RepID=A0A7J5YDS1_DISMA|nr:hypothetical protein F7725_020642 [Dissostichus mawsoni]
MKFTLFVMHVIMCLCQFAVKMSSGTRKVLQKGMPVCCYDCIRCAEGDISNITDSVTCVRCHPEFWSNERRDACVKKEAEFLSYEEIMGALLTAASLFGTCITAVVAFIFFRYRKTPIVRANNSELSFLLLFSLTLCFLCSLTFIGRPQICPACCDTQHSASPLSSVSLCSGETIVVLMAFRATLPGSNMMKWFGPAQQKLTVLGFTLIQSTVMSLLRPLLLVLLMGKGDSVCRLQGSALNRLNCSKMVTLLLEAFFPFAQGRITMSSTQRWPEQGWALLHLLLVASFSQAEEPVCTQRGDPEIPQMFKDGDIMLGGIFSFHSSWKNRRDSYMDKPLPLQCTSLNFRGFQFAQAMLFAVEEINNSTDLLPGISLGYRIYDSCGSIAKSVRVALAFANGNEVVSQPSEVPCTRPAQVQAIMGRSSSPCMAMATAIGPFHIPMISHFATCACLSDKSKYPSFLRTIPSDYYQSRALAQLVKHFGWTWVGAIRTNDDYGNNGMATFTETAQQLGICLEYSVSFFRTDPPDKIQKIIDIIKASTSKVIIAFLSHMDLDVILHEFSHHNLTGYQWVGSEGWIFDSQTATVDKHHILDGAIGLSIPKAHVSGMREFMLDVRPLNVSSNEMFTTFYETSSSQSFIKKSKECTGREDLTEVQNSFTDMSLMPIFNNVYKGVYAAAHALHFILSCNKTCNTKVQLDPFTILQHIRTIQFKTKEGEEVYFNENGDPAAKYEIINWKPRENEFVEFVTVGLYDASLPANKQLHLQNETITWTQNSQQVKYSKITVVANYSLFVSL